MIREYRRGQWEIKYIRAEEIISRQFQLNGLYICKRQHSLLMVARKEAIKKRKCHLFIFSTSVRMNVGAHDKCCQIYCTSIQYLSYSKCNNAPNVFLNSTEFVKSSCSYTKFQFQYFNIYLIKQPKVYNGFFATLGIKRKSIIVLNQMQFLQIPQWTQITNGHKGCQVSAIRQSRAVCREQTCQI